MTLKRLFIQPEKKLITKLWHVGIHGLYLRLINSFLFSRTVSLVFNGHTGFAQLSLEYGLPQASALSPVLFRFYIHDLGELFVNKQCTDFYKFADDGTAKVSGVTLQYSLSTMQSVLDEMEDGYQLSKEQNRDTVIETGDLSNILFKFILCRYDLDER